MEVVVLDTPDAVAHAGAQAFVETVQSTPDAVLGLATGSSPVGVYALLQRRCADGEVSFAACSAFTLDEYVGLSPDHPQLYRAVIRRDFVDGIDMPASRLHSPDGAAADIPAACRAYEEAIAASGGVDVQILGIGTDGHIAFNEPGSSLASRTRIKTLTAQTRRDNGRFFDGDVDAVPTHCLTQGVGTIMRARHVVLVATGAAKAEAVSRFVEGPVTASCPASALQWHPHVTVLLDADAAGRLERLEYYRETYAAKPSWQGF